MLVQLQYLRGIAALSVVYFHAVLQLYNISPGTTPAFPVFGEFGVDLFFVLSGFVMWYTTAGRRTTTLAFYGRRIARIVPLYWSITILAAAIALVAPSLLKSTRFDLPHLFASLTFIPWLNPAGLAGSEITPVVVPGWTLNYEMYFYAVFGLLLLAPERWRIPALAGIVLLVGLACRLLPDSTAGRFYGNPIVFEFVAGAALAHAYVRGWRLLRNVAILAMVLGLAIPVIADLYDLERFRAILFGVPAMGVLYGALSLDWSGKPWLAPLRAIGDASYSLYLTHVFVLAGGRVLFTHLPEAVRTPSLFLVLAIAVSAAVALAVYRFFELPVDRALRNIASRPLSRVRNTGLSSL